MINFDLPTMKEMGSWVESDSLSLLLKAALTRTLDFSNVAITFLGDRFNSNLLAASLIRRNDGYLDSAAIAVLTLPRKYARVRKSYNKEHINQQTVLDHLDGNQIVSTSTVTVVGKLIATEAAICVRISSGIDDNFLDILLDERLLEKQLDSWNCNRAEFINANRSKATPRIYTLSLHEGSMVIRNWCIPLEIVKIESSIDRNRRVQKRIKSRNRYSPLKDVSINGKSFLFYSNLDSIANAGESLLEAEEAIFQNGFFRCANEVKPFADLMSPKAPILRIMEMNNALFKKSEKSEYLLKQMNSCNQVNGFNQHSLFDMRILISLIRFCVDAVDFDKSGISFVEAKNKAVDSYTVRI